MAHRRIGPGPTIAAALAALAAALTTSAALGQAAGGKGGAAGHAGGGGAAGGAIGPGETVLLGQRMENPDGWLEPLVPASLRGGTFGGLAAWQWAGLVVTVVGGWVVAQLGSRAAIGALNRLGRRAVATWDDQVLLAERRPVRLILLALLVELGSTQLALPPGAESLLGHLVYTALVVGVAWMLLGAINAGSDVYQGSLPDDTVGELRSRSIRTRLAVARSVGSVLLLLTSVAVLLMQFEVVRSVGVSLLASAGVAGVVLGFAAQKSLGGVIAGLQISIAQPVRIGDLIFFEGEAGTIEEINLTYVVLGLWDERRLIVPITKLLETTLHNWTRSEKPMLAWVILHADPTLPVPALRAALEAYCRGNPRCDGRDVGLRVTDMAPDTITLRAHASCASADDVFELRWELREAMVRALADLDGGSYLPRRRQLELATPAAGAVSPGPAAIDQKGA